MSANDAPDNIISLKGRAEHKPQTRGPVSITFFASRVWLEDRISQSLSITVDAEDGDYERVILQVKESGGIALPPEGQDFWIIPWPPAAIRVSPQRSTGTNRSSASGAVSMRR